jgi:hypothetical protein
MRITAELCAVNVSSSHQFKKEIGAYSENELVITKMEYSIRTGFTTHITKSINFANLVNLARPIIWK